MPRTCEILFTFNTPVFVFDTSHGLLQGRLHAEFVMRALTLCLQYVSTYAIYMHMEEEGFGAIPACV